MRISIHTAPSISGPWSNRGTALPQGSEIQLKGNGDLWAPDVTKIGNQYYLLYAVSSFGSQDSSIGWATSPNMEVGSWTDHGSTGVNSTTGDPYNAIDPNLVIENGKLYMAFGSLWNDLFITPLEGPQLLKGAGERQIAYKPSGEHALEASYIHHFGDSYYLYFSAGKCCGLDTNRPQPGREYHIFVCRSQSATGPYVDKTGRLCREGGGTLLLPSHDNVYAPGGQGVYDDPELGPLLYYHHIDTNIGYADADKIFGWNRLIFKNGWPVVQ